MVKQRMLPASLLCLLMLAGCTYSPLFLLEESSLKRALPSDISMSDYVEKDWFGNKVTVAEKLARLGAYTDGDRIRDGTGEEIRFVKHEDRSLKASPEALKQEQDALRELKKYFTVVVVQPDPGPAATAPVLAAGNATGAKQADLPPPSAVPPSNTTPANSAPAQPGALTAAGGWQPAARPTAPATTGWQQAK